MKQSVLEMFGFMHGWWVYSSVMSDELWSEDGFLKVGPQALAR